MRSALRRTHILIQEEAASEIPNHFSAHLSDLDMRIVEAVPEGGNWKDIPESIPSKRLDQIRESFKQGGGSRSTYYGRLRADMPSYTINTYFNRPGNGCHIHPSQNRVLSQREAARLQSFPDRFRFAGPQSIVNNQIGNAVPPLLAYQIAGQLGTPGVFVDLFSGAGGLGVGLHVGRLAAARRQRHRIKVSKNLQLQRTRQCRPWKHHRSRSSGRDDFAGSRAARAKPRQATLDPRWTAVSRLLDGGL